MIIAVDVDYRDCCAVAAAICFEEWAATTPTDELTVIIPTVEEYVPGQFYQRELPCIQAVLSKQNFDLGTIIVDGYVHLGVDQKPGLGLHLWNAIDQSVPIIGVAKNYFRGTPTECELLRSTSRKPLFITSIGVELATAKSQIASMVGANRIPTLLKHVDMLCRQTPCKSNP